MFWHELSTHFHSSLQSFDRFQMGIHVAGQADVGFEEFWFIVKPNSKVYKPPVARSLHTTVLSFL